MVLKVDESAFNNLLHLNVEQFYASLSDSEKGKIKEIEQCAELLKKTPEYQYLERALRIVTKCNLTLHSTIVHEKRKLEEDLISLKQAKSNLDETNASLASVFSSCEILKQVQYKRIIK